MGGDDVRRMRKKTYTKLFRQQFVETWLSTCDETTFSEHCNRFGVSRQAAYEWMEKYEESGIDALDTRSSAPHTCPHETDSKTVQLIIDARRHHPTWGPRKLKAWLEATTPWDLDLPAPSTIGDILKRTGLVPTRKRRRHVARYSSPFMNVAAPNDVWTTDFKGHFKLLDGSRCYPLTLADCFSRFLLRCDAFVSPSAAIRSSFEKAFIEYGLPSAIRSDNGSPFAATSVPGGLSVLSVWWVRLGILPERIAPGSPWENGRHERMHRTLKAEATQPPQANRRQQQRAFDAFQHEFNNERPHEALGQRPPRTMYTGSKRSYPKRLPELEYATTYQLRRVSDAGVISCAGRRLFLSTVLRGEVVALKQTDELRSELYFGPIFLGIVDSSKSELHLTRASSDRPPPRVEDDNDPF